MYDKIKNYINKHPEILSKKYSLLSLKKHHKEFLNELQNIEWLKLYNFHWKKILYYAINNLTEIQLCQICKKREAVFYGLERGYSRTCSVECARKDLIWKNKVSKSTDHKLRIKKAQHTILKKYGVSNVSQIKEVKEKKRQTCIKHYGVDHPLKVPEIANQVSEKVKSKRLQMVEKIKKTNLQRYGKESYTQTDSYKKRMTELWDNKEYRKKRIEHIRSYTSSKEFREKQRLKTKNWWRNIDEKKRQQFYQSISKSLKKFFSDKKTKEETIKKRLKTILEKTDDKLIKELDVNKNNLEDAYKIIKYHITKSVRVKYGVETVFQLDNIQKKCQSTVKRKYNVDNISQHISFKKKLRQKAVNRAHYILSNDFDVLNVQIFTHDYKKSFLKLRCKKCSKEFERKIHGVRYKDIRCPFCKEMTSIELIVKDILTYTNLNYVFQDRQLISPYELDFLLPEHNLAIETNGLYWHSDMFVDQNYHQIKYKLCREKGVKLLQFFEDELMEKTDIVKSIILANCNIHSIVIHGRKCLVKEISTNQKNEFLRNNHLMGEDRCTIKLGAFYNNELISVMTFHSGNITVNSLKKTTTWELSRFCIKKFYKVYGIAGKLFSFFRKNYINQENIIITTYASLRTGDGSVYKKLGFEFVSETQPGYFYVKGFSRFNRFYAVSNRKNRNLSEWEDMLKQGFFRVFDAGNNKYVWKLS